MIKRPIAILSAIMLTMPVMAQTPTQPQATQLTGQLAAAIFENLLNTAASPQCQNTVHQAESEYESSGKLNIDDLGRACKTELITIGGLIALLALAPRDNGYHHGYGGMPFE